MCPCTGAFTGHPAAPRPSQGDHPAGGGGAGDPPKPDVVTAAAGPRRRQTDAQSAGQKRRRPLTSARQITALLTKPPFLSTGAGSPGAHPPPHRHCSCARTYPALPSCYRGDHEPFRLHQHHVHVQTEPGHYRAGKSTKTLPTLQGIEQKFRIGGVELQRSVAPSSGASVSGQGRC